MKSAYELAMSRLEKEKPIAKVSEKTKTLLAEIDSEFDARIAEKKLFLDGEISKSLSDPEATNELKRQLSLEIARLEEKREDKKDKLRKDVEA